MAQTLAEQAYEHIRQKLLNGELLPGDRIRYVQLGREMGISATPVREAIGKLASEGLVELVPQLGALVRDLGRDEAIELYEMREALEPYAAAKAADRMSPAVLREVAATVETMRDVARKLRSSGETSLSRAMRDRLLDADVAFHMLIIDSAGNTRLKKAVGDFQILSRILRAERHDYDLWAVATAYMYHRRILRSLQRKDGVVAARWMAHHIRYSLRVTLEAWDRANRNQWWASSEGPQAMEPDGSGAAGAPPAIT